MTTAIAFCCAGGFRMSSPALVKRSGDCSGAGHENRLRFISSCSTHRSGDDWRSRLRDRRSWARWGGGPGGRRDKGQKGGSDEGRARQKKKKGKQREGPLRRRPKGGGSGKTPLKTTPRGGGGKKTSSKTPGPWSRE